jgi:hypothetical protein
MVKMNSLRILCGRVLQFGQVHLQRIPFHGLSNLVVQCGRDSRSDLFQHAKPDKKMKITSLELMKSTEVAQSIEQMGNK